MNNLIKKIETEYEFYYLRMASTSKANIFSASKEIEETKNIYFSLKRYVEKETKEVKNKLCLLDNLLEEVSRFHQARPENEIPKNIELFFKQFQ